MAELSDGDRGNLVEQPGILALGEVLLAALLGRDVLGRALG